MYALARVVEERLSPLLSESIHRIYPIPIRDFKRPLALAGQLHVLEPLGSTTRRSLKAKQKVGCQPSIITWMSRWPKPGVRLLKEVIQPQVPLRLPCYDFTPVADLAVGAPSRVTTSGAVNSHGVTGGVYKARERIHRGMLIRDY